MSTFVLVHGHHIGAWAWDGVRRRLENAGHEVHAPALAGMGERIAELAPDVGVMTHVGEITQLIATLAMRNVVLVGHSYAGIVAGGAAARVPVQIAWLVLLDAALPVHGGRLFDQIPDVEEPVRAAARATDRGFVIDAPDPSAAGVTEPALRRLCLERFTPAPLRTFDDLLDAPPGALATVPGAYIRCLRYPPSAGPAAVVCGRPGWICRELDAGHLPMLTHPDELAGMLAEIAAMAAAA